MILQIKSTNPNLSFIIKKNPATGMLIKENRKGLLCGWYSDPQTFNCYFKDADGSTSFGAAPDVDFEYIDVTRYNSAMCVNSILSEFFHVNVKNQADEDTFDFEHQVTVPMMYIRNIKYVDIFKDYFSEYKITTTELVGKNYKVIFETNKSLHHLFNFINLFIIFNAIKNEDYLYVDDAIIKKYMSCLEVIDAPYFIRYVFKVNLLVNSKLFDAHVKTLEKSNREKMVFSKGSSSEGRRRDVKRLLSFDNSIVDLGCGSGYYAFDFASELDDDLEYIAIDRDEKVLESFRKRIFKKNEDKIITFKSFEEFLQSTLDKKYDVIMAEVIEHSEKEDATKMLKEVLSFDRLNSVIITSPNKAFNQFFLFDDDEMRHEDHKFEMTEEEFHNWIKENVDSKYKVEFFGSGDLVNDIYMTLGVRIFV